MHSESNQPCVREMINVNLLGQLQGSVSFMLLVTFPTKRDSHPQIIGTLIRLLLWTNSIKLLRRKYLAETEWVLLVIFVAAQQSESHCSWLSSNNKGGKRWVKMGQQV